MTDIVERLLDPRNNDPSDRFEAAEEIEQRRAECGEWVLKNAALHRRVAQLEIDLATEQRRVMRLCQSLNNCVPGTQLKPKSIMGNFDE